MSKLDDKIELEAYLDDLLLHPEDHLEDPPLEIVGAFIYGIQTRNPFNVNFSDYLHNISHSEKKQIQAIIKYAHKNSTLPTTPQQKANFAKLISELPKDKVAKENETKRQQEDRAKQEDDTAFLDGALDRLAELKKQIGEQLRKKSPNTMTVQQLENDIHSLQERVAKLISDPNIATRKKASQLVNDVIDSVNDTQAKLDIIDQNRQHLLTTENITADELNKIKFKLSTNVYSYSHLPQVRAKTEEVLQLIRDIRKDKLDPSKMQDMPIYEALKMHKQWDSNAEFDSPKFGRMLPEHNTQGFYVMHFKQESEQKEEKNDIKMHISVNPQQTVQAMEIINNLIQSEKYANLLSEYKVADIDHVNNTMQKSREAAVKKLTQILSNDPHIDIQKTIDDLKAAYPNTENVINQVLSQIPDERKAAIENGLKVVASTEIGTIISGERILNDALFTVYFKNDFPPEDLQAFCNDLNIKLQEQNILAGNLAQTDVCVNPYCGVTIDHVLDNTGKKVYLDSNKPEDVEKRRKALSENPLTKDFIEQPEITAEQQLSLMAEHVDQKDENGMSALTAKGFSEIPMNERVAFASKLLVERFNQTKNVNLVYRNPDMFTKWVVKEIFNNLKFPIDPDMKKEFFILVEKAVGSPENNMAPNPQAKEQLRQFFAEPRSEIVQTLAPFYHAYIDHVKKEFFENYKPTNLDLPKDEQKHEYDTLLSQRINEAKKQFLGHVSFPFVESLVFELQEKDDFSPARKGRLATGFRNLRLEDGMMDELLVALEKSSQNAPSVKSETIEKAFSLYEQGKKAFVDVKTHHREMMAPIEQRATELYRTVNRLASSYPKDSEFKAIFERIAGSIENIKTELDHKLLRGEHITDKDVAQVNTLFDNMMKSVKDSLNNTHLGGNSLLHEAVKNNNKDLVETALKAGSDPRLKSTHYKRGIFGALKDALKGKPGDFFKNLFNAPPRSAIEVAKLLGHHELLEPLQTKAQELKQAELAPVEQSISQLDTALGNQTEVKVEPEVDPSLSNANVFQLQKTKSHFVAGWEKRLSDEITALNDRLVPSDQNKIAMYALNQVKDYMLAHIDMNPTQIETLQKVIQRVTEQASITFPLSVQLLLKDLGEGKILENKPPLPTQQDKNFNQKWGEYLDSLIKELKSDPINQYILKQIKEHLSNPTPTSRTPDGFNKMLDRVENEGRNNLNQDVKKAIDGMRKGSLPEEAPKAQLRKL
ncbi:hypothetical protein [Candidatus Berkiella aquae]|uniref:Uncharacterized protein n=1 Tax=Candidatus Berkiella aquae TaxID=295108 RepID=A0A0Q9YM41_9GAMM|nr:hypothetical protein [Candidatus Berkiella aquae]MCS5710488.1 hypothetical protein [Candidatus Berkiella aquae]